MGERRIYAMQIYQRVTPPFLLTLKKWMKFFSRIDFSALATEEEDVLSIFDGGTCSGHFGFGGTWGFRGVLIIIGRLRIWQY